MQDDMILIKIWMLFGAIVIIGLICYQLIDIGFMMPVASQKANDYCKSKGFDQYKEFNRIGILSENPVGIKCEYAERYTDLGVRTNN